MKKNLQVILITVIFIISHGCSKTSKKLASDSNMDLIEESIVGNVDMNTEESNSFIEERIFDTLNYYLIKNIEIPPGLYNQVFGHELSDIDKAYIKEIKGKSKSLNPVIVSFKTVESDREKEFVDLHLFNSNWELVKSLSIKYEMDYDLFVQDYKFLNDSTLMLLKEHGLSYESDLTVYTEIILELDKDIYLDTIQVKIDTINYE